MVVAPASANTIAKLAGGHCDSMLTTSFLAATAPRIVVPAMNNRMWEDAAVRDNVATLRDRGVEVMEPGEGALASRGEHGAGRLREPAEIMATLEAALGSAAAGPWDGLRVLVTAGGTREAIDPVRFIGNRSSGRMGVALAASAARRGASVTLVAANVGVPAPPGVDVVAVESAAELAEAAAAAFAEADVLLMAAAVADFRPAESAGGKIVREGSGGLDLHLEPTEDVLAALAGRRRGDQTLVGFAAEHGGDFVERARGKLAAQGDRRDRRQRRLRPFDRVRLRRQRGDRGHGDGRRGDTPRDQGRGRRGDPRPGRGAARGCDALAPADFPDGVDRLPTLDPWPARGHLRALHAGHEPARERRLRGRDGAARQGRGARAREDLGA